MQGTAWEAKLKTAQLRRSKRVQPTAQAVGVMETIQAPEGRKKLAPQIFLIHDDPILLEECAEFVLK